MDDDPLVFVTQVRQRISHRVLSLPSAVKDQTDLGDAVSLNQIPPDILDVPFRYHEQDFIDERGALKYA